MPVSSTTGSPSISARSIRVGPSPFCSTATTPVPPTPSVTSKPTARSSSGPRFAPEAEAWVFKPCFARFGEAALIGPKSEELTQIAPTPEAPWLAQRRVSGSEACFYAVAHRGKLAAFVAYRSSWRLDGGASYAFEPLGNTEVAALHDIAMRLASCAAMVSRSSHR